ncbi:hypothetical protein MRX96_058806 [Rhipicephalus microplus]
MVVGGHVERRHTPSRLHTLWLPRRADGRPVGNGDNVSSRSDHASASRTPPRQTQSSVLERASPADTSKEAAIVRVFALLGLAGVPPLIPSKKTKIRAALPT